MMTTHPLPTYFISHGGGPWPWMKDAMPGVFDQLERSLLQMPGELGATPRAILAISGHWETAGFAVQSNPHPPMLYDYSGFPEHTFHISYPAPGSPELARRVQGLLSQAGFPVTLDEKRGFDHGVFAPFFVVYPEANVPIVQLSIRADYDPATHLAVGRALAPLRSEGILLVGSGLSYHNMRRFSAAGAAPSKAFDTWLTETVCSTPPLERTRKLIDWSSAPPARLCHPQEDHFIPLLVAAGAAELEPGTRTYHEETLFGNITASSYRFGNEPGKQEQSH